MGFSPNPGVLAAKLEACAGLMLKVPEVGTKAALDLVKASVLAELGGKTTLRGVGKRGARIGVKTTVTGGAGTALGEATATGPMQLVERDTRAHRIPKVRGARARKRIIVIPGYGPKAYANHPGTKGKHPWEKGVAHAVPLLDDAYGKGVVAAFAAVF